MNEGTSDHNACFSKVRNSFRWQPELAHFCTENLETKKDEILNFIDPNFINSQHDMDMFVDVTITCAPETRNQVHPVLYP